MMFWGVVRVIVGKKMRGAWEQAQLKDGTGVDLTLSPPSPGSAGLGNSCCIVTLG